MPLRLLALTLASLAASGLMVTSAHASGQLPPSSHPPQKFESFVACVAHLGGKEFSDKARAEPEPTVMGEGVTRQVKVYSKGVKPGNGDGTALYEVEWGTEVRTIMPEQKSIRTNYTYERDHWQCNGGELTGVKIRGYATPGFAPIAEAGSDAAQK